jgi:hypothetical protein
MKKLMVLMMALLLAMPAMADDKNDDENMKTLFGSGPVKSGGYGAPEIKLTTINGGDMGLLVGGKGGWIVNSCFSIGGGGYGLVTSHKIADYKMAPQYPSTSKDSTAYLQMGYGGLILEYINSSDDVIHFTISALIGGGMANYSEKAYSYNNHNYNDNYHSNVVTPIVVFEPGATVDINITKFMRIGLGASYRMVWQTDLPATKNSDLSGVSGNLSFKFGKF